MASLTSDGATRSDFPDLRWRNTEGHCCRNSGIRWEKKHNYIAEIAKQSILFMSFVGENISKGDRSPMRDAAELPPQLLPPLSLTNFLQWGAPLPPGQNLCRPTRAREHKRSSVLWTFGLPAKRWHTAVGISLSASRVVEAGPWPQPCSPEILLCISGLTLLEWNKACCPCDGISLRAAAGPEAQTETPCVLSRPSPASPSSLQTLPC